MRSMVIRYFFLILSMLLSTLAVRAGAYQFSVRDTTRQEDTIDLNRQVINDPKKGFKDLFIQRETINGISTTELNPRAISFVQDYIARHQTHLDKLRDWGRPYFDMMDIIFARHNLPKELKYLAVIESHLKTFAVSWAGAVGPWQFMPETARRMGLKVTNRIDERTDYYKATHAAARYLSELFDVYKDWLLVIAAYNGGPGSVNSAIRKSGSRDFWMLQYNLPAESRDHVKKFIATHYIMEGNGSVTTLTRDELKDLNLASSVNPATRNLSTEELNNSQVQKVSGRYNSIVIVKYTGFEYVHFSRYNPEFDKLISANGVYELRLPTDKMKIFLEKRHEILNESLEILINSFRQQMNEKPGRQNSKKQKTGFK